MLIDLASMMLGVAFGMAIGALLAYSIISAVVNRKKKGEGR